MKWGRSDTSPAYGVLSDAIAKRWRIGSINAVFDEEPGDWGIDVGGVEAVSSSLTVSMIWVINQAMSE